HDAARVRGRDADGFPLPRAAAPGTIAADLDHKGRAAMMKLLSRPLSPYGRKVKMTIGLKGLKDKIEVVAVDTNVLANPEITVANPLAMIPLLVLKPGEAIFDSAVICEYLDSLTPSPVLFPKAGPERWKTQTLGSLTDGM